MQLVLITTKAVSSNPVHGEVYSIQHYVIKFVNDLRQVGGFLWVLRFPPPFSEYDGYSASGIKEYGYGYQTLLSTIFHLYWCRKPEYPATSYWQTSSHKDVSCTPRHEKKFEFSTLVVICSDCIGNCKSIHHTTKTTTVPIYEYYRYVLIRSRIWR